MASCITPTFGNSSCPQLQLTVTETSSTATTSTLTWTLQYVAHGYAAYTSVSKSYTAVVDGETVASGSYNINGLTGTTTIKSGTKTITKISSAQTISFSCSMAFNLNWNGTYGGTKSASGSISVGAVTSYTISYNANGGTGAPGSQTKLAGTNITLSTVKPTRTGYTFAGWATSASGSVAYQPGATYSSNASVTLYAKWTALTYTVSYNANGGTGAPGSQTKTYGTNLTLSATKPTRTNYNFKGWGTSASSTTVAYAAGASYTTNAAITLYAIWELAYTKPRIINFTVDRCTSSGASSETGTYARVKFSWATDKTVSSIKINHKVSTGSTWTATSVSATGTSGNVDTIIGANGLSTEYEYNVQAVVTDASGSNDLIRNVAPMSFIMDFLNGGKGISFGKPATVANRVDSKWDMQAPYFYGTHKGNWYDEGDNRSVATNPADYNHTSRFRGIKNQSTIGLSAGSTYAYVMGLKGWSSQSGGYAHELAFHNKGVHHRIATSDSAWGSWRQLAYADEVTQLSNKVSQLNNNLTYAISSTESKTHDTFFGKPVYTKSFSFTTAVNAGTTLAIAHNITNIDNIWVDLSNSFFKSLNNTNKYAVPTVTSMYFNSVGSGNNLSCAVDKTNIYSYADGGWNENWAKVITVRYTKMTN